MAVTLPPYEFELSTVHGGLDALCLAGHDVNALGGPTRPGLDARLGRTWLGSHYEPRYLGHELAEKSLTVAVALGPLRLHDIYTVEGSLIARRVVVENVGHEEVQLTGLRLWVPGAGMGASAGCTFDAPANMVRPRVPLPLAASQPLQGEPRPDFAPGARGRMGHAMEDAPDVSPGLMVVHNSALRLSLLTWYFSDAEAATPRVTGDGHYADLVHEVALAGWLPPGASLEGSTQYLMLHRGSYEEALDAFRATYARMGVVPPLYGAPPDWVRGAAIYEAHPGPFGGFRGLAAHIPRLAEMGFNVLYLLPIWPYDNRSGRPWDENWLGSGSPYAIRDFERFEPTLGTAEDFRHLVEMAHAHGMRVLLDFVAQGCATDARYVHEHPEWFCRDEGGNLISSHGWTDTYSFDWANPDFHQYMLSWSLRLVRDYGVDGYRVDAPHGKEPNWDRRLPYHASATNLGVVHLLDRLQLELKALNPEAVLLCELFGPLFVRNHDLACDYHPMVMLYELLSQRLTPAEFLTWLKDYWAVMPPGALRVAFTETHDTRRFHPPAYAWRGSAAERAMFGILVACGFIPMVWAGQERGLEDFYRAILAARAASRAICEGEFVYDAVATGSAFHSETRAGDGHLWVLNLVRRADDEIVWALVSLWPERTTFAFHLDADALGLDPSATYRLHDLVADEDLDEYGRTAWRGSELGDFTLTPEPYRPYLLRLDSAGTQGFSKN